MIYKQFLRVLRTKYSYYMFKQNEITIEIIPRYHIFSKFGRGGRNYLYYTLYTAQVNVYSCCVYLTNTFKILLVFLGQRNHSSIFLLLASFTGDTLNYTKNGFDNLVLK